MKSIELRGEDYLRFSKIVYLSDPDKSDLSELKNWEQPLKFYPNSSVLQQKREGPCGLFAVLNSHIVLKQYESGITNSTQEYLFTLILDIFKRVSTYSNVHQSEDKPLYVFCDCLIPENNFIHFKYTESYEEAYDFLVKTCYTNVYNSCLMITLSIIFTSLRMNEFKNAPEDSYISYDKMTSMSLVWLILNGSTSIKNLQDTEDSNYKGMMQKEIGIKVLNHTDRRVIGTWLNPDAKIFVCLRDFHFFTIKVKDENSTIVYDSMDSKSPYEIDPKVL